MSDSGHDPRLEQAAEWFLRVRSDADADRQLEGLRRWIDSDPRNADAWREVSATWNELGVHAAAPDIVQLRSDSLDHARRPAKVCIRPVIRYAVAASVATALVVAVLFAPGRFAEDVYVTGLGERRVLSLDDGSTVTLDAHSRLRVKLGKQRDLALESGQARFDVARDVSRPFVVEAGGRTIRALGTQFNVERVGDDVFVATLEGRVAVSDRNVSSAPLQLAAGEGAASIEGEALNRLTAIDVAKVTAWQGGKLRFDDEPLMRAVERVNRYSRLRVEVAPTLAALRISGAFDTGDTVAFVDAVAAYFPVTVERDGDTLRLVSRDP